MIGPQHHPQYAQAWLAYGAINAAPATGAALKAFSGNHDPGFVITAQWHLAIRRVPEPGFVSVSLAIIVAWLSIAHTRRQ